MKFCLILVKKDVPTRFHTTPNLMIYCLIIITFAIYFNSNVQFPNQFYGILLLLSTGDNYLLVPGSAPLGPNRAHHTKHVYGERVREREREKKKPWQIPSWHVLVQSQQWNHQNNVKNLFRVTNWDTSGIFIVNFEHSQFLCFPCWFWISKCRLGTGLVSPSGNHRQESFQLLTYVWLCITPKNIYLFKTNNGNIRTMQEICSKLTIKTSEWRQWCRSGVFLINFEHISNIFPTFPLLTFNKWMPAG